MIVESVEVHSDTIVAPNVLAIGQTGPDLRRVVLADEDHVEVGIVVAQVGRRRRAHRGAVAGITLAEAGHRHCPRAVEPVRAAPEIVELGRLGHADDPERWLRILLWFGILGEGRGRRQREQQTQND